MSIDSLPGLTDELRTRVGEVLARQQFLDYNNLGTDDHAPVVLAALTELATAVGIEVEEANYCDSCSARIPVADNVTLCEQCVYEANARPADDPATHDRVADAIDFWESMASTNPRAAEIAGDEPMLEAFLDEVQRRLVADPSLPGAQAVRDVLDDIRRGTCECSDPTHFGGPGHPFGAETAIVRAESGRDWCGECDRHRTAFTGIFTG